MGRMIGFDRKVELSWLDMTVGLCQQEITPAAIADRLKVMLRSEIDGVEARRKTVTVLTRIWVRLPEQHRFLRAEALELAQHVQPQERMWLHWGMSLLAYPFFCDVANVVGQLGQLQTIFSVAQVDRRMVERWGQRSTLTRAVQRLVRTFHEWATLEEEGDRGTYSLANGQVTGDLDLALWLLECALRAHGAEQVTMRELCRLPYLFPFDLGAFAGEVRRSQRFEVTHQGLDLEMVTVGPQ